MRWTELAPEQWHAMENTVGIDLSPEIVDDHNWVYGQMQNEERERERAFWREHSSDVKVKLLPQFHYQWSGDPGPVIEVLRRGKADADLQAWLAGMIEQIKYGRGVFASRKPTSKRVGDMGPLYDAVMDIEDVERLLRKRGRRKVRDRAVEVVAFEYLVPLEKVRNYLKRGKNERQRLPRFE